MFQKQLLQQQRGPELIERLSCRDEATAHIGGDRRPAAETMLISSVAQAREY
jgi:hypothetical protein